MEEIEKMIRDCLYSAEFGENKSSHTIRALRKDLQQFFGYLIENEKIKNIKDVDSMAIKRFLNYLSENKVGKRSLNRKISSMRSFYRYLISQEKIEINPLEFIDFPNFVEERPTFITFEELEKIRGVIPNKNIYKLRDRVMIELLISTGITSSELLNLGENIIDFEKREIYIKNNKNLRIVFFSQRARELLKEYIELKKEIEKERYNPDILFINGSHQRLNDRSLRRIIDRYSEAVGIDREISPYSFRHTFGVVMLYGGMNINYLKDLMGISNIERVKIYENYIHLVPKIWNVKDKIEDMKV